MKKVKIKVTKEYKPRVIIRGNTGTRVMRSKKDKANTRLIYDTSNTSLSDFEFQMKQMKSKYEEAKHYYNQRKNRVSMMLDTWMRNREYEVAKIRKLEKLLWEKLNIGTSINVILLQIDDFYKEV